MMITLEELIQRWFRHLQLIFEAIGQAHMQYLKNATHKKREKIEHCRNYMKAAFNDPNRKIRAAGVANIKDAILIESGRHFLTDTQRNGLKGLYDSIEELHEIFEAKVKIGIATGLPIDEAIEAAHMQIQSEAPPALEQLNKGYEALTKKELNEHRIDTIREGVTLIIPEISNRSMLKAADSLEKEIPVQRIRMRT